MKLDISKAVWYNRIMIDINEIWKELDKPDPYHKVVNGKTVAVFPTLKEKKAVNKEHKNCGVDCKYRYTI